MPVLLLRTAQSCHAQALHSTVQHYGANAANAPDPSLVLANHELDYEALYALELPGRGRGAPFGSP